MTDRGQRPSGRQLLLGAWVLASDLVTTLRSPGKRIRYASAGRFVRGTLYHPPGEASGAPAVLLLHTAMGLTPHEHAFARRLAREGFVTLVTAYSGRTTGAVLCDDELRAGLEQVALDGLRYLRADPSVDPVKAAAVGMSLGGYLAMFLATARQAVPLRAAVIYYGVYRLAEPAMASLRTPLLILQGEKDSRDFVAAAAAAAELAARHDAPCELVTYPDTAHRFDLFDPFGFAARDAWSRTVSFLKRHVR